MHILSIVGARPNFMKIAPFVRAIEARNAAGRRPALRHTLVHTGQHYDEAMSASFFEALSIPRPDIDLGIGSGSHAEQVGRTMIALEKVFSEQRPDWVVVVGDVNATCAGAITARKQHIKLAHIEAGLRSFDMRMPEEINRLVTDRLSDLLFTPDELSSRNLRNEGIPEDRIAFVGNIMIDTLETHRARAAALGLEEILATSRCRTANIENPTSDARSPAPDLHQGSYAALTLHRPSNVDDPAVLRRLADFFTTEVTGEMPLLWTVHPRTEKRLREDGLWDSLVEADNLYLLRPVGYHAMLRLVMGAAVLFTDSGGLQEESCVLGTPCITLRENTERPVTLREHGGLSVLTGNDPKRIRAAFRDCLSDSPAPGTRHRPPPSTRQPPTKRPRNWDGHTAGRIVERLAREGC